MSSLAKMVKCNARYWLATAPKQTATAPISTQTPSLSGYPIRSAENTLPAPLPKRVYRHRNPSNPLSPPARRRQSAQSPRQWSGRVGRGRWLPAAGWTTAGEVGSARRSGGVAQFQRFVPQKERQAHRAGAEQQQGQPFGWRWGARRVPSVRGRPATARQRAGKAADGGGGKAGTRLVSSE